MASAFRTTLKSQWNAFLNKGNNLRFWWIPILTVIVCVISLVVLHSSYWGDNDAVYIIAFVVANLILFLLYVYLIKRPSEEKQALRSRLFGFRMYLGAAEEKQLQHFNPPTMTPEVFEKYLPYAIAFKVEKIWGDRFQSMISRALVDNRYHPRLVQRFHHELRLVLVAHEQLAQQQRAVIEHAAFQERWLRRGWFFRRWRWWRRGRWVVEGSGILLHTAILPSTLPL